MLTPDAVSPNQTSHATAIAFQPRDRPNEPRARDAYGDGRVVSAMTRRASAPPRTRPRAQRRVDHASGDAPIVSAALDSHLGSYHPHSQKGDGSGTGFRLSGAWEVGGEMPPDLVDRRGRQCPRTSRKSSRSLRTVDQDGSARSGSETTEVRQPQSRRELHARRRLPGPQRAGRTRRSGSASRRR